MPWLAASLSGGRSSASCARSVRVNLMYVPLPLAARALIVWRSHGGRLNRAVVFDAVALGLPLLAYGVQLSLFNYWMTGSPSKSPFVYGDGDFGSVAFAHPLLRTTLFNLWHGLLSYVVRGPNDRNESR